MSICVNGHLVDAHARYCGRCGGEVSERGSVVSGPFERLAIRPSAELVAELLRLLDEDEPVEEMFVGVASANAEPAWLLVITSRRVMIIPSGGKVDASDRDRSGLRGVAQTTVMDAGSTSGWVALLYEDIPYETFHGSLEDASRFASRCNDELEGNRGATYWWDELPLEFWERFPRAQLVVAPERPQGKAASAAVGVVATGIQVVVFHGRHDRDQFFIPWRDVSNITIESFAKTSMLSVESSRGTYVFELRDIVASEIRARLKPVLAGVVGSNEDNEHRSDDPIDQISRLGELRDSGLITPTEFDESKTALLRKLTTPTGDFRS